MTARLASQNGSFLLFCEKVRLEHDQQERAMTWVIDRFEGDFAVLENTRRETREVARTQLPAQAKPGDALTATKDGYRLNPGETARRKAEIKKLTDDLWA